MSTDKLPAGEFSAWLAATRAAQLERGTADVPCGDCTGCCEGSYFIHIAPGETDALRAIPPALLFPAPGLPPGHKVMGFDQRGRCPMLEDGRCSIYAQRPQTCRTYDCRVFPAAGIAAGGADKRKVEERARQWLFATPTEADRAALKATRAAAAFLRSHAAAFPDGFVPGNAVQLAVLATRVHEAFLGDAADDAARIEAALRLARHFATRLEAADR